MANKNLKSFQFPGFLQDIYTIPETVIDNTLTQSGQAADAKAVGDELDKKVDKVTGKGLSTEDFTTAEKTKLAGIAEGARTLTIDPTLTQAGQAADAKETGNEIRKIAERVKSIQLFDRANFVNGYTLQSTTGVSTPDDLTENSALFVTNVITFDEPLTVNTNFALKIDGVSRILSYTLLNGNYVRAGNYSSSNIITGANYKYITVLASENVPIYKIRISALIASNPDYGQLYFCKESDWSEDMSLEYYNYPLLKGFLPKNHLIESADANPINYEGEEVKAFYKGIAIGDSLTEGTFNTDGSQFVVRKQYAYPMCFYKKTGVILRNFGIGGSTAQSWYTRYQNTTFPAYDFAIIALGVNDILQNVDHATTITYIDNIVKKLQSTNSDVKCFIATVNKAYSASTGWDTLNTAIRNYAESEANCYLLDIGNYGLTKPNTAYVNGHLTALGYNELAREFANLISWQMANNKADFDRIQFSGTQYTSLPTD